MPDANTTPDYLNLLRLDGRGFVVLGAGDGIGGQTCRALAQAGAEVLCVDLSQAAADRTAEACGGHAHVADVSSRTDMENVFARAQALFGEQFYGIVMVVGVTQAGQLESLDDEALQRQFDLVLRPAMLAVQIGAPLLARNDRGSIVLVGSLAGLRATRRVAAYGVAKAGVHHLVRAASHEYGPLGVRVNGVAPGRIAASGVFRPSPEAVEAIEAVVPLRRLGSPSEIAAPILFLSSDLAAYVTGVVMEADGGIAQVSALPSSSG